MPDTKQYLISLPGFEDQGRWDVQTYEKKKHELFKKYPDAQIFEFSKYKADEEQGENDYYHIQLDGLEGEGVWDAKTFAEKKDKLFQKYPNAQVYRSRGVDYWYDKALADEESIKTMQGELESLNKELGGKQRWSPEYNAIEAQISDKRGQMAQIRSGYDANPRVIEAKEKYEAEYAAALEEYQKNYLPNLRTMIQQWEKDDVDTGAASLEKGFNMAGGGVATSFAVSSAMHNQLSGTKGKAEALKQDRYQAALDFLDKAERIRQSQSSFAEGLENVAMNWIESGTTRSDLETYSEIYGILQRLEKDLGHINNISEETLMQHLSRSEQALILGFFEYNAAQAEVQDSTRWEYKAGQIAGEAIPFILEFIATGGLSSAASKGATKGLAKALTSWIKGATKGTFRRTARKVVAKGIRGAAQGLTQAAIITPLRPTAYTNVTKAMTQIGEDGKLKDSASDIAIAVADEYIETLSELSGGAISKLIGTPAKWLGGKVLGKETFEKWSTALLDNNVTKFLARGQFHGMPVEIAEEYFGNALREIYDPKALDHMHEDGNFLSMVIGFAPMTLLGAGVGYGQYAYAKNSVNKGAAKLRETLLANGYEDGQIEHLLNFEKELTPQSLAKELDPVLKAMALKGASKESQQAVVDYAIAVSRYKAMKGAVNAQETQLRKDKLAELEGTWGKFYQTKNEGTKWQEQNVTTAQLYDGRSVFLTSEKNEMGEYAAIDMETGETMPVSESDIAIIEDKEGNAAEVMNTQSLDSYLTELIMSERKTDEQMRMQQEEASQIAALQQRLAEEGKLNIGTSDAPVYIAYLPEQSNDGMAHFTQEDGSESILTWNQVGDYLGQPIRVLTDEQMHEAEAAAMATEEAQRRAEMAQTDEQMDKTDETVDEALQSEEKAAPVHIPMNPDGTVNTDLFWDQNPEEWVKWNDQQRQDNGVDSMAQIAAGLQTAEAKLAEASKLPFATPTQREAKDKEMGFWQDKINRYNALLEQYQLAAAAEEAQMARAYAAERLEAAEAALADKMTKAPKRSDYRFTPQYMQAKQKFDAEVASLQEEVTRWQNELAQYGEAPVQQDEAVPVENVSVVEEQQPEEVAPSAEELAAQLDAALASGESREDEAVVALMQSYADAISAGVPAKVVTRRNVLQTLKDAGVSETKMAEVKDALRRIQYIVNGFEANGVAYILADSVIISDNLRSTYVHERQHIMTAVSGIDAALMTMTSREELQEAIAKLTNSNFYDGKGHMVLADELVSMAMERAYKGENLDEVFEQIGFKNENAINFIKDIDNAQRNDSGLSLARVAGIGGNAAEGGSRQDGRTALSGSTEVGEQGPRSVGRGGETAGDNTSGRGVGFSVSPNEAVSEATEILDKKGLGVDTQNEDVRFSVRYIPTKDQREAILSSIMAVTGRTREVAEKWLDSETSLAAMVGEEIQYLDYPVDSKYKAIKDNSDNPQGTVDFNNICRKRLSFTQMFTRLQRRFPNRVFTADELADIRTIMSKDGLTVACGLCYVEDRRQMVGEVANSFINELQKGFADYASENATKRKNADKFLALIGEDAYVPSIYDLTTQEGADKLYNEHRGIWEAFQAFNNARGQQSQNLLQGYAEYKREILSWSDKKVKSVNDNGGLRIFSYSAFEAHHLLDIVQIIIDCAAKGVKIQGYTKVPAFARAVANTGIKLNRSLIPLGDTGIVDGQLAFDPVEGIDVNDPDFLESNDNVGNIFIGINDVQIRMAMADPRIHYIIPYHARQKENIRKKLNVGEWVKYISTQNERNLSDGKRVKDNVNIYTEVLTDDVTNDRQFVEKYLQICKEKGRIPKFDQFLNKDAEGNYVYTPGYHKFLVDFKLFDENGNILPQQPVVAEFDDAFNMQILEDYVKGEKESTGDQMNETYDKIVEAIGLDESAAEGEDIRFSARTDEQRQALFDKAKAQFGLTNNFNAAGYMLPDGSLLDFSEANDGGNPNQRSQDHREIEGIIMDEGIEYDSRWMCLADFMNEGAIRLLPEYAGINLMKAPTKEQRQRLFDFIYKYNGEVILEIADERLNNVAYVEYDRRTSPSRIFRDIDRYFNEGIVPQQDTRFSASNNNQEIFVSNAAKAVEGIKQEKATPAQWLAMLEKNGGLKAAEDKWMGLSDWLKSSDKKTLTKQEVLDFINENMIVIEEERYGEVELSALQDEFNEIYDSIIDNVGNEDESNLQLWEVVMNPMERAWEELRDRYSGGDDFDMAFSYDRHGNIEINDPDAAGYFLGVKPINDTRLDYTTSGLQNKQEIALVVPNIEPWNEEDDIHFGDAGEGRAVAWVRFGETEVPVQDAAYTRLQEIYDRLNELEMKVSSTGISHEEYEERARLREERNELQEIETRYHKVLVIDEIQSKRHQEGREKGYITEAQIAEGRARHESLRVAAKEANAKLYDFIGTLVEKYPNTEYSVESARGNLGRFTVEDRLKFSELVDAQRDSEYELRHYKAPTGIPDAPFEKNWHELAMKRMLRYAAENGYDYIAWTKGAQQSERYNIGTIVNSIEGRDYNERENIDALGSNREITLYQSHGETALYVSRADGRIYDYEGVGLGVSVENELLSDVVGKELADKLMADGDVNISNGELSIGGEGMRGFYDKMLPAFMNKYGKKWGIKVEDINLPNLEDGLTMHSVPVTEEMKASVMEGQTMFSVQLDPAVRAEMDVIKATAMVNGNYMLAPNGQPTKLTEDQWAMVRTKNFINWFGDWINDPENASKVVDENGEPMVVYHGSPYGAITQFDRRGHSVSGLKEFGTYFSTSKELAQLYAYARQQAKGDVEKYELEKARLDAIIFDNETPARIALDAFDELDRLEESQKPRVYEVFLNIRKPKVFDAGRSNGWDGWHKLKQDVGYDIKSGVEAIEAISGHNRAARMNETYDGIIAKNIADVHSEASEDLMGDVFLVFDETPENIKSATETTGLFSENEDIRFSAIVPHESSMDEIDQMFASLNRDPFVRDLYAKVSELAHKMNLKIKFVEPWSEAGGANILDKVKYNVDYFNSNDYAQTKAGVLLHELIHSVTVYAVAAKNSSVLTQEMKDAVKQMEAIYDEIKDDPAFADTYGAKSAKEMVAELSNPKFRQKLREKNLFQRIIDAIKQLLGLDKGTNALDNLEGTLEYMIENFDQNAFDAVVEANQNSDAYIRFSAVTDPFKIAELEAGDKIKVYRAMQLIDGKLYPPMSAKVDGKMREPIELGKWEQAEERPDLIDAKGNFKLNKGGKGKSPVPARYNPYIHTSTTPLNDQFSSAQSRPELVTVEVEVPASELTSGNKAEKAKDAVGKVEWKAGVVQAKLSGTREVILSRWDKPIRIVPDSEVAEKIIEMFDGKDITMPSNVVTPSLRAELEKRGVPFVETDNNGRPVSFSVSEMPVDEIVETGIQKISEEGKKAKTSLKQRLDDIDSKLYYVMRMVAAAQKKYDKKTVDIMTNVAKELLRGGALSDMTRGEISRLLAAIKNATGKADLTDAANRLMDLMVSNQLRHAKNTFAQMLKIKASKVSASGVEAQGTLDVVGQRLITTVKESVGLTLEQIDDRIAIAKERMDEDSETTRKNAEIDLAALEIARKYVEGVKASEAEEADLRHELELAIEDKEAGKMTAEGLREFRKATEDAIRENRLQRTAAYRNLLGEMAKMIAESVIRAGDFRNAEKDRIDRIHHFANSDLEGLPAEAHQMKESAFWNSNIVRFFLKPLSSFEQMLKHFGSKNAEGKGYLYNHFIPGWVEATNKEFSGTMEAYSQLDAKAREVFGGKVKRWSDLFAVEKKKPTMTVKIWDDGKMKEYELSQGNLLYIYMVNKMTDGKMKLRKMGITEEDVRNIYNNLDPRFIELAEWIQNDFLPSLRDKYNAVHERMFGAPMAAIDNYFPIRVLANARTRDVEVGTPEGNSNPSTITGNIIKRTKNSLALDVLGSDAFDVVLEHIQQMEHWAAFAEWNRDLNTLLSYKKFRNRVQNMSGIYGAGTKAWEEFRASAEIAAGVYRPKTSAMDKILSKVVRGLTAGKIGFRFWTAMKQVLSAPAFAPYTSPATMLKNMAMPKASWDWAMENLEGFEKRWKSRDMGNVRLKKNAAGIERWTDDWMDTMTKIGMTPNAFVDAVTCAIGAKSVYETAYAKYVDSGYSAADADKKAKVDATVAFNTTQQSGEGAFLSSLQADRDLAAYMTTTYRNANFGMGREFFDAARNLKHRVTPGYKAESIAFMTKQMMRDGLSEANAKRAAERIYRNGLFKDSARVVTFGFVMQFLWNMGNSIIYQLFGDDDEEKQKMIEDAAFRAIFGPIENLTLGNVILDGVMVAKEGDMTKFNPSLSPAGQDLTRLIETLSSDPVAGVSDLVNILCQCMIGTNPQVAADAALAIYDACDGDMETSKEVGVALLRILQAPQSQVDKLIEDEIDFTKDKGLDLTIEEFARNYAEYKRKKNAPYTFFLYSDEEERKKEDRYIKRFTKRAEELKRTRGNEEAKAWYNYVDNEYKQVDETVNELRGNIKKAAKRGDSVGAYEFAEKLNELTQTPEFKRYAERVGRVKLYEKLKQNMKDIPLSRDEFEEQMLEIRRQLVEEMQSAE